MRNRLLATAAGIMVAASVLGEAPPWLRWGVAVIAGGGAAAAIHIGAALTRAAVSTVTVGFGNFIVATAEAVLAVITAVLAVLLPFAALLLIVAVVLLAWRAISRRRAVA